MIEDHGYYEGNGLVDGYPWYLHARGWRWSVAIAPRGKEPVDVVFGEVNGYYHEEPYDERTEMTKEALWACVQKCLEEFLQIGFNVEAGEIHDPVLRQFEQSSI